MATLEFWEITSIEEHISPCQASDGTVFYVRDKLESSIYVFSDGLKVPAFKTWDGEISDFQCFGIKMYFITTTRKGEIIRSFTLISRTINEEVVIYRACDDPSKGIIMDTREEKLKGCRIKAIHRGKLIFSNIELKEDCHLFSNTIVVTCGDGCTIANDEHPLIYFCANISKLSSFFALNTTTMDIFKIDLPRPVDKSTTAYFYNIIGVHKGQITVIRRTATKMGKWTIEVCKAKFPEALENFELEAAIPLEIREKRKRDEEEEMRRREEEERRFTEIIEKTVSEKVDQKLDSIIEDMHKLRLRVGALEKGNADLKNQLHDSKVQEARRS